MANDLHMTVEELERFEELSEHVEIDQKKFVKIFAKFDRAIARWKTNVEFEKCQEKAEQFLKLRGSRLLMHVVRSCSLYHLISLNFVKTHASTHGTQDGQYTTRK